MTTEVFDVAVVGAGPAGSTFARFLALSKPEARIAIIDGQTRERSKVCGGLLSPDAQKVLASFDMTLPKEVLADPQIFAVETIDIPRRHVRYYQRNYLNMDRYAFDRWLLSLVPTSVSVISGRCRSVERDEDGKFLLSVGEQTIKARAIVGADGASSIVRRSFFDKPIKKYVAIQQHFKNDGQRVPFYSCIFDPATSDSCSWSIHKDGYIIFGGAFEQSLCRDAFEKQKARFQEMLGNDLGAPLKTEACLVCSPRHIRDLCIGKEGIYLIGGVEITHSLLAEISHHRDLIKQSYKLHHQGGKSKHRHSRKESILGFWTSLYLFFSAPASILGHCITAVQIQIR